MNVSGLARSAISTVEHIGPQWLGAAAGAAAAGAVIVPNHRVLAGGLAAAAVLALAMYATKPANAASACGAGCAGGDGGSYDAAPPQGNPLAHAGLAPRNTVEQTASGSGCKSCG